MSCDLYVIGHEHQTFGHAVKVGIANNAVDRLRTFQTANAEELKMFFCFTFEDRRIAAEVERIFHQSEVAGSIRGEWVGSPPIEVIFYLTVIIARALSRRYAGKQLSDVRRNCGMLDAFEIVDALPGSTQNKLNEQIELVREFIS